MIWLGHFLGLDDPSGPMYLFWSGVGADISELAIFGGLIGVLRRHTCHVKGCWRIGRHKAGDHIVCARHHPKGPPAAADLATVGTAIREPAEETMTSPNEGVS